MEKAYSFLRAPWFATVLTLLVIVAGMLGSIYSPEIRGAFPFYWGKNGWGPLSHEACLFWILALLAAGGYFFREQAQERYQRKLQESTLRQAESFERLIRTLPPKSFLTFFSQLYNAAAAGFSAVAFEEEPSAESQKQSIRHILRMIATLAKKFDGDDPGVKYAANVMLFRASEQIDDAAAEEISAQLLFSDGSISVQKLEGVLQLNPELSTTEEDEDGAPDPDMMPMALAIPKVKEVNGLYRVLPGAPFAFVEGEPDLFADSTHLRDWCEQYGDFPRSTIDEVGNFFRKSSVRGFVSIPLFNFNGDGSDNTDQKPIAVLNVHCDRAGLLAQGEALAHFVDINRPFQVMLTKLLLRLIAA
jgi:hypothetical protein